MKARVFLRMCRMNGLVSESNEQVACDYPQWIVGDFFLSGGSRLAMIVWYQMSMNPGGRVLTAEVGRPSESTSHI